MLEWIKIILILIIMTLISFLLGSKVLRKLKFKNEFYFATPLGFYLFLACFQLLAYPVQYLHLPTWILGLIIIFLFGFILFFCRTEIKEFRNVPWKKLIIVLFLVIICTVMYVFSSNLELVCNNQSWALLSAQDDIYYYTRFISVNADITARVNAIEPITGMSGIVPNLYAFTGILHLYSGLCMLFNLKAWTFVVWFNFIFLRFIAFLNIFNIVKIFNGSKRVRIIIAIAFIGALFSGRGFINGFEPVYFRGYTGIGFILIYSILLYFKTRNRNWLILYTMIMSGMLACQSTQMFLGVILLTSIAVYDSLINRCFDVKKISFIATPILIYVLAFISYEKEFSFVLGIVFFFILINILYYWKKEIFVWQIVPVIGGITFLVMLIYGVFAQNPIYSLSQYQEVFGQYFNTDILSNSEAVSGSFDIINDLLQKGIWIVVIYFLFKWKQCSFEIKFCCVFFICIIIFFYNPLVMPFISTFMTDIVYGRIENVALSAVFYFTFLSYFDEKFHWLGKICLISSLSVLLVIVMEFSAYINHFSKYRESSVLKYKMDQSVIEVSEYLDAYFYDQEITVLYPITFANLRLYNESFKTSELVPMWYQNSFYFDDFIYHYEDLDELMKIQCMLVMPIDYFTNYYYEFEPDKVPDIKEILLKSDADIVIMNKWEDSIGEDRYYHNILSEFTEIIYDNDRIQVYQIYR